MSYDKQCSSCGGFCGRGGCKRENVKPEQEPVAWMCADEDMTRKGYSRFSRNCEGEWNIPVYTTPPARKPLTDEEIQEMRYSLDFPCGKHPFINIVKAVERAHGVGGGE